MVPRKAPIWKVAKDQAAPRPRAYQQLPGPAGLGTAFRRTTQDHPVDDEVRTLLQREQRTAAADLYVITMRAHTKDALDAAARPEYEI
jgi:hypothetical protein